MTAVGAERTPLARLFAVGYRSLIEDLHVELRSRGWTDVRPAYGFVLLACREPTTAGALATQMGVTKQAASQLVDSMVAAGYVERRSGHGDDDGRRKPIVLTWRGRTLLSTVEAIYRELEQRWAEVIGHDRVERLRADLEAILNDPISHQLPPVRPLW